MKNGQKLIDNINKGMDAYHDDVEAMSDKDLWDHCFADGDIKEDDFCVQELKKRFLYGDFTDDKKCRQYLIDEAGYTPDQIDKIGSDIAERVKETIKQLSELPKEAPQKLEQSECDFHEPYFGARYPDGRCIDGYIYDEDDCDDEGRLYMNEDAPPCPKCNHKEWLDQFEDDYEMQGYESFEKGQHEYKHEEIWFEQPEDIELIKTWWQKGYDLYLKECKEEYEADKAEYELSSTATTGDKSDEG